MVDGSVGEPRGGCSRKGALSPVVAANIGFALSIGAGEAAAGLLYGDDVDAALWTASLHKANEYMQHRDRQLARWIGEDIARRMR